MSGAVPEQPPSTPGNGEALVADDQGRKVRYYFWFFANISYLPSSSRNYVEAILSKLPESQLHLSTPIASVGNASDGAVYVKSATGQSLKFDYVIMACHSDTTLSLLKEGSGLTEEEGKILSRFTWNQNEAVLHNDINVGPSI
jgi:predicted NAD/FAD-binding protein